MHSFSCSKNWGAIRLIALCGLWGKYLCVCKRERERVNGVFMKSIYHHTFKKRFFNGTFGLSVPFPDDTRAVYPCSTAQHAPPAGGVGVRRPGLPGSGDLRLEKEMLVLLHPPPPRHYDSQPGSYNLDPQSHELHPGKRLVPAKCFNRVL